MSVEEYLPIVKPPNHEELTMKNTIKSCLAFSITLLFLSVSSAVFAGQGLEKLYTKTGYPFEPLVKRSQLVRILYQRQDETVTCRTEITQGSIVWEGQEKKARHDDFITEPLRSCLERSEAKRLLKNTYQ
ncbi:hypothetical protein Patl_0996 [Paraglaciecola sp. T6c]|nr:hypothetical protein Patl_0996 [Paraglaciecola sp. T6c]